MKILLLGAQGQLGKALAQSLAPLGEIIPSTRERCDLTDATALHQQLGLIGPQVIVNAAAYTAVDMAEIDLAQAWAVNAYMPRVLAQWAQTHQALLVHYSSDYVFDGKKSGPYVESDSPAPLNVYGRSKWAADQAIAQHCERHFILRTSWLHGVGGNNFVKTILALARQRDRLEVVDDQWGAPTSVVDVAALTAHMVHAARSNPAVPYGLYHASAAGLTTWYGLACYVVEHAAAAGLLAGRTCPTLVACSSSQFLRPAQRPHNSALDNGLLKARWGWQMPDWRHGVDQLLMHLTLEEAKKLPTGQAKIMAQKNPRP